MQFQVITAGKESRIESEGGERAHTLVKLVDLNARNEFFYSLDDLMSDGNTHS